MNTTRRKRRSRSNAAAPLSSEQRGRDERVVRAPARPWGASESREGRGACAYPLADERRGGARAARREGADSSESRADELLLHLPRERGVAQRLAPDRVGARALVAVVAAAAALRAGRSRELSARSTRSPLELRPERAAAAAAAARDRLERGEARRELGVLGGELVDAALEPARARRACALDGRARGGAGRAAARGHRRAQQLDLARGGEPSGRRRRRERRIGLRLPEHGRKRRNLTVAREKSLDGSQIHILV